MSIHVHVVVVLRRLWLYGFTACEKEMFSERGVVFFLRKWNGVYPKGKKVMTEFALGHVVLIFSVHLGPCIYMYG